MRLEGKRTIIVGAGQTPGETIGNGHAAALLFAREGASVLCVDRIEERALSTAAEIQAAGGRAAAFAADISNTEDCAALVRAGVEAWGRLDILVNNAGIGGGDAPPTESRRRLGNGSFRSTSQACCGPSRRRCR